MPRDHDTWKCGVKILNWLHVTDSATRVSATLYCGQQVWICARLILYLTFRGMCSCELLSLCVNLHHGDVPSHGRSVSCWTVVCQIHTCALTKGLVCACACVCVCVCVCECVCVCARLHVWVWERERQRKRLREREREAQMDGWSGTNKLSTTSLDWTL